MHATIIARVESGLWFFVCIEELHSKNTLRHVIKMALSVDKWTRNRLREALHNCQGPEYKVMGLMAYCT